MICKFPSFFSQLTLKIGHVTLLALRREFGLGVIIRAAVGWCIMLRSIHYVLGERMDKDRHVRACLGGTDSVPA
jgi:hypothetical protein